MESSNTHFCSNLVMVLIPYYFEISQITFQIVFVCSCITPSHYHHCANLSEDIALIKCLSDIFCRVCKIKHTFLSYPLYNIWLCVCFSLPISLVMIGIIYALSYYHHQIENMNYHSLLRVRSWNNGMRCLFLYIILKKIGHIFYATQSSVHHFIAIGQFKLGLHSRNAEFGSKSAISSRMNLKCDGWPWKIIAHRFFGILIWCIIS